MTKGTQGPEFEAIIEEDWKIDVADAEELFQQKYLM